MSPSMRREWIEMSKGAIHEQKYKMSPSMRREWIEMSSTGLALSTPKVSLHAEGVD